MWNSPATALERELGSGERLVWSGQPRRGIRLTPADIFVIPFSLFWCGFSIFWVYMALKATKSAGPAGVVFPLFGLPFVAIGLHMVFGRFIADARVRERTFYGITSERIIIVSGLSARQTKSLNLRTLTDISLTERPDGSGTITFGSTHPLGHWIPSGAFTWPGAGQYAPPAFDMIDRAKEVYEIIRRTQKTAA